MTVQCPKGMMPVPSGGVIYPDEPEYCIQKDPVTRGAYEKDSFNMSVRVWDGSKYVTYGPYGLTPEERNKPATNMTWDQALQHCQSQFEGGSLPTAKQWLKGCVTFCSTSGKVRLEEGVPYVSKSSIVLWDQETLLTKEEAEINRKATGAPDMASSSLYYWNPLGIPLEWLWNESSFDEISGLKWTAKMWPIPYMAASTYGNARHFHHEFWIGFRCVAPPQKQKIEK